MVVPNAVKIGAVKIVQLQEDLQICALKTTKIISGKQSGQRGESFPLWEFEGFDEVERSRVCGCIGNGWVSGHGTSQPISPACRHSTYLFIYLRTYLLTYLLTYLHTYLLTYLFTYLLIYLLTYLHTYLLTYLVTYFLTYLFTGLLTCLLTYLHAYYLLAYLVTYVRTYFYYMLTYLLI